MKIKSIPTPTGLLGSENDCHFHINYSLTNARGLCQLSFKAKILFILLCIFSRRSLSFCNSLERHLFSCIISSNLVSRCLVFAINFDFWAELLRRCV